MNQVLEMNRLYGTDDAAMLQFANDLHEHLVKNLSDFTDFDPGLDLVFASNVLEGIRKAELFGTEEEANRLLSKLSIELDLQMNACYDYFRGMKLFIENAFPNKKSIWNEFGYRELHTARKSPERMMYFMNNLHQAAVHHKEKLASSGFDNWRLSAIATLYAELQELNNRRELQKARKQSAPNERILLLNNCWIACQRICQAGKSIYSKDYSRFKLFIVPWEESQEKTTGMYLGAVSPGTTLNVPVQALNPDSLLVLYNTGAVPLRFEGSDKSAYPVSGGILIESGDSHALRLSAIAGAGITSPQYLNVSHTSVAAGVGAYLVEVIEHIPLPLPKTRLPDIPRSQPGYC